MTEIDVPDWVVEAGVKAMQTVTHWESHEDFRQKVSQAVITAALGAWVETVGFAVPESLHQSKRRMSWFDVWRTPHPPFTIPLYTLRQEKPE